MTKPTQLPVGGGGVNSVLLRQARALWKFAEVALYPRPGAPVGTAATALVLLRQALQLALAALVDDADCALEELFVMEGTQKALADAARDTHVTLSQIQDGLVRASPARLAQYPRPTVTVNARLSLRFVRQLLAALPDGDARALRRKRGTVLGVVAGLLALGALVVVGRAPAIRLFCGADLLEGLPFSTSSTYDDFSAKDHTSHGRPTAILFHTRDDDPSWVEYDLGAVRKIHRLEVRNRTDCCGDRAIPLVLEASVDHKDYRELARQSENFTDWTVNFETTEARYVRLKVQKKSILHLERIVIR